MREETINGISYRIGRLNAKQQFNVLRRLGPVFAAAKPAAQLWLSQADDEGAKPLDRAALVDNIFDAVGPLASALGSLTDETSDYVIGTCLGVVTMNRQGSVWAPVANRSGQLMFDDMDLATMLRLVMLVLQENLSNFFLTANGSSPGE